MANIESTEPEAPGNASFQPNPQRQPVQYAQQPPTEWQQQAGPQTDHGTAQHPFEPVTWESSEYISHTKSSNWYMLFFAATLIITAIIFIITREILSSLTVFIVGISAGFFAARPPSMRRYEINEHELKIDERSYPLENFKSFSVVEEGAKDSIWLKPVKRFAQFQIVYFNPEDEQRIIDILSVLLPHEERELDNLDIISKKLRF